MTARQDTRELMHDVFTRCNISLNFDDANTLRRAQLTLHRWAEQECGDSDNYKSWSIERDEESEIPFMCIYPHDSNQTRRYRIPDRERGALRRIKAVCERNGLNFYHQGDPRGCALYVSHVPLPSNDYTRGVACVAQETP